MQDKTFGMILRSLREREKLSVKEVVEKLKKYNLDITDKTLYSYENNKRAASADMLLALCQIYNCNNILETFAGLEPDYSIPDDSEWRIIEKYRFIVEHFADGANLIDSVLDKVYAIAEQLKNQKEHIEELEGTLPPNTVSNPGTRIINYYYRLASAGTGQILFDMPPTKRIEIPDIQKYKKADYAIGVNGNSMEPTYKDGDTLLVEMTDQIEVGEIGIFSVNNECFVKKLGHEELISLNPEYQNIPLNETAHCMGRVIDKL